MRSNFRVVCVGPAALDFIFDPIVGTLRQHGHEVAHFVDFGKFARESSTVLKSADVLVAIGSFHCTRELMIQAPQLRAVVSPFIGTEGFDEIGRDSARHRRGQRPGARKLSEYG